MCRFVVHWGMKLEGWRRGGGITVGPRRQLDEKALRLAFLLPLTPWPALHFIASQGTYSTGRHSADALAPVAGWAYLTALSAGLVGLIMIVGSRRNREWLPHWLGFALVNGVAMVAYIGANGNYYA